MTDTARPVPQTRTRREIGKDNMVVATIELLVARGPDQITVRDVAKASGHHHRFVQAWFGGKVGLFRAAFDRMLFDQAQQMQDPLSRSAGFEPNLRAIAVLMNWLVATEPGSLDGPRPTPIIDQVVETYQTNFGLEPDVARLMALRMVGASLAAMLFPGPLGVTAEDVIGVTNLERELAELLAKSRATR